MASAAQQIFINSGISALPLTERFGTYSPDEQFAFDQELVISLPTGHVQLRNQLNPKILYSSDEYAFRTGESNTSRSGVEFLSKLKQFTKVEILSLRWMWAVMIFLSPAV